ncbi:hypothetical protein [Fimbriiglobus ruber]|uniref:Transposase n=1 Tax=Fimbriiglobus ruber TaxID=1908690 RepID=A0A225DSK4_9BACT|nr:Transposase [Fimbriiglobus ruber]
MHITHWSRADLARQAILDGIVETISPSMVRRILQQVNLQPHRTRYWRTARLDERFQERAEKVLWCYGNAERLAREDLWVVCTDEVPNLQVLEREPLRRARPDHIEQHEFEYTRHGTVNLLLFLAIHTGQMDLTVVAANNATLRFPKFGGDEVNGVDSAQGVHRCPVPERRTRPSTSSRR